MMMDPQQELFIEIREKLIEHGYDVFDAGLPPENTPYPFIHLGETYAADDANKSAVFGNITQTINVWHNDPLKRGTMSVMMLDIKNICRALDHTSNFAWRVVSMEQNMLDDNSTGSTLLHGVLSVEFKFS